MQDYQSMASILPAVKINTDSENLIKKFRFQDQLNSTKKFKSKTKKFKTKKILKNLLFEKKFN